MTFTVAGATGRLLPLTPMLLEHGHDVRVVTRETESSTARGLRALGAEIRRGDFAEPHTIASAAEGADALFVAGTAHRVGPDGEARHGITAADAAKASGVGHFVYLSGSGAGANTGVPVFAGKHAVEAHIRSLALPYSIIAPVYFMENLLNPWNLHGLSQGIFPSPVGVCRHLQHVAIADVTAFARLVLERPDEFLGQRVEIASDELTGAAAAQALSRVVGRRFDPQQVSLESV